jgi:hypothetical protein
MRTGRCAMSVMRGACRGTTRSPHSQPTGHTAHPTIRCVPLQHLHHHHYWHIIIIILWCGRCLCSRGGGCLTGGERAAACQLATSPAPPAPPLLLQCNAGEHCRFWKQLLGCSLLLAPLQTITAAAAAAAATALALQMQPALTAPSPPGAARARRQAPRQ